MSHQKRPWDTLGTDRTSPEAVYAKRIALSSSRKPQFTYTGSDCSNDDSNQDYSTDTLFSVTPASSPTPNALNAPPASIAIRTANAQLGGEPECAAEDLSGRRLLCFGMLLDGRIKLFRQSNSSSYPSFLRSALMDHMALGIQFRHDSVTILLDPCEEIGLLDKRMAIMLRSLKEMAPRTAFKVFLGHDEEPGVSNGLENKTTVGLPLEIEIYGLDENYGEIGIKLSAAGMYLQEPFNLNPRITYCNPHFLSWEEDGTMPQLNCSVDEVATDLEAEIEAILKSSSPVLVTADVEQDPRISTQLRSHQLSALRFMLVREQENQDILTLWKPHCINKKNGFIHMITQEKRSLKPLESCGGILSDEMGMGKSLVVIALIVHTLDIARSSVEYYKSRIMGEEVDEASQPQTIIIAPKSTLHGWDQEVKKHTSNHLNTYIYHGQGASISHQNLAKYDVVITSYEMVLSDANRSRTLLNTFWFRIVLDEAHYIRNRTNAFQAILNLKTNRRWCLTGTPVQNGLDDLFTLTEFLQFHPVENRRNAHRWILDPLKRREEYAVENLRLLMKAVSLRRSRDLEMKHVRSDIEIPINLSKPEREKYDIIRANAGRLKASTAKTASHILLSYILQMRQICSHGVEEQCSTSRITAAQPSMTSHTFCNKCSEPLPRSLALKPSRIRSSEAAYCSECAIEEANNLSLSNDLLFTLNNNNEEREIPKFQTEIDVIENVNDDIEMKIDTTYQKPQRFSSKIQSVVDNLTQIRERRNHDLLPIKSLVFSVWTTTLDAVEHALAINDMAFMRIDGSSGLEERRKAIERFQSEPDVCVMLLSFGSGSVGLNLKTATYVHILEPQWNPMVEAQAAARIDRLDQDKDIFVLRYVVQNSIEKNIIARQRRKLWLAKLSTSFDPVTDGSENFGDLHSLVQQ